MGKHGHSLLIVAGALFATSEINEYATNVAAHNGCWRTPASRLAARPGGGACGGLNQANILSEGYIPIAL